MSSNLPDISVFDNFCPVIDRVKASAMAAGFGTWAPPKGAIGSSIYEGMGFQGWHAPMIHSFSASIGRPVYPASMFFRVTNKCTEKAYTHSDRESGSVTCVCYLSEHKEKSGTAFFRHRETGLTEMPPYEELQKEEYAKLRKDIVDGGEDEWEEMAFVTGVFNRAVIFKAPLFHARRPKTGFGETAEEGRIVWACHAEIGPA